MSDAPGLRGRDDELQRLEAALADTRRGRGRMVLVEGEAGIGKTRLLDEVAALAVELDVAVRRGAAEELEQGRPFGALLDALGPVLPAQLDDAGEATAEEARYLAQDALIDHVDTLTSRGPLLLALDDLHWADRATLSTVWALARASAPSPLLLLVTFRPIPHSPELERVVAGCIELGAEHLELHPLDDDALADVAAEIVGRPPGPGLVDQLRGARGNPFVGIELLRALDAEGALEVVDDRTEVRAEGLPPALRHSLLRRLTALPADARELLRVAAVLGGAGRVDEVATLVGKPVGELAPLVSEATRAGLLEAQSERLAFRHDLIREALYEDVPEPARVALHAAAARALEGTADPGVVARHLVLGSVPGDAAALHALRRVGTELASRRPDAAVEVLERALELEDDRTARVEIAADLAEALLEAGRAAAAGAVATEAQSHAMSSAMSARLHLANADACAHQSRVPEAIAAFAAALDSGALSPAEAASARARQAENRVWTFALDQASVEAERALEEGRRLGLPAVITEALTTRSAVHQFRAELDLAVAAGREAVVAAGNDAGALRLTPHAYLGLALLAADCTEEARAVAEEGRRRAVELGQVIILPNYHTLLSRLAWFTGDWDDALIEVDAGAELADDFGLRFGSAANEAIRGLIAFHRGDRETAAGVLERYHAGGRSASGEGAGSELLVLLKARVLEADGDTAGAARELLGLFEVERTLGMRSARLWPGPDCVRLALAAGEHATASDIADDLASIAARADTASARAAAGLGRATIERDAAAMVGAADDFATAGRPLDEVRAREAAGATLADEGSRDEAVVVLGVALEAAKRLGALHDVRRISARLRGLGARVPTIVFGTRPQSGWESLTDGELEVARLVADGLTNPEVGTRLFISRRTVSTHLSHIFTKLGLRSRVELTAEVLRREGAPAG